MQCAITRRFKFPPISFSEAWSFAATEELRDGTCQLQSVSACSKIPDTKAEKLTTRGKTDCVVAPFSNLSRNLVVVADVHNMLAQMLILGYRNVCLHN